MEQRIFAAVQPGEEIRYQPCFGNRNLFFEWKNRLLMEGNVTRCNGRYFWVFSETETLNESTMFRRAIRMNPWVCALLITTAGAIGGVVNAFLSDNGFALPRKLSGVWCPGAISNILVGAMAAFSSWAFYGSGAAIELAGNQTARNIISLRFSALAGAFLVGVAGAKWITNEVDKRLLKESVKVAATGRPIALEQSEHIVEGSPREVLQEVKRACATGKCASATNPAMVA
jgi:hypothetical protein